MGIGKTRRIPALGFEPGSAAWKESALPQWKPIALPLRPQRSRRAGREPSQCIMQPKNVNLERDARVTLSLCAPEPYSEADRGVKTCEEMEKERADDVPSGNACFSASDGF